MIFTEALQKHPGIFCIYWHFTAHSGW